MVSISSHDVAIQTVLNAELCRNKVGNPGRSDLPKYLDLVTAFDIETTRLPDIEHSFMYVWQWQFGPDCLIMGRTWEEFKDLCSKLDLFIRHAFGDKARLVVWVHNLPYEFQFLRGIYDFPQEDVFCMDSRKVVKATLYHRFELRCSYIHSNMSLDLFTKKMGCQIRKLTGTFDYDKIRYPWTELTEEELEYCAHDVAALVEAITREMELDGDTLATIPMTSTGYVRRDARNALLPPKPANEDAESERKRKKQRTAYQLFVKDQKPDYKLYLALREAFRGGNTHASRFKAKKILRNVHSCDRSSSYPDVLVNCEYPVTEFHNRGPCTGERFLKQINDHHKAMVIRIAMFGVQLRDPWDPCPYLAKAKCRLIQNGVYDNGRIMAATYLETTLTDIDFRIVQQHYTASQYQIFDSWEATYGHLPDEFRDLIREYYRLKTSLKGDKDQAVFYDKVKAKINALYGMTAQNPLKENIIFAPWEDVLRWYVEHPEFHMPDPGPNYIPDESKTPEAMLIQNQKRAFLVYQWGVWVTAHARRELQEMIDLAGDNFVYTDTDSVKYIGDLDLTEYNDRITRRSFHNGAFADDASGKRHYMGVYEIEQDYDRFITLGAKKYAYEQDGKCHVTCAGVNKSLGGPELEQHGGLEAFRTGFTFRDAGGTEAVYNDNCDFWIQRDGHDLHITSNVVIRPSEYTLGITGEYKFLLHHAELMAKLDREMQLNNLLTV